VQLKFRGEKTAKVLGTLAGEGAAPGKVVSGIVVRKVRSYYTTSHVLL
jgi:hypothetical protein